MNSSYFFSFYLLLFFLFPVSSAFEPVNKEVEALISIRSDLIDPHGALSNWDEDSVDPCSWAMVTCSSENLVIFLEASGQNLSGNLSGRIGDLKNIQQILLQNNNLTGKISAELGSLPKLQTLDLSSNGFSGFVPDSLGQLTNLRYLRLNNNSLSGPFPTSLSRISQLSFLDMSFNNLSGSVPPFSAKTFNVMGNPMICGNQTTVACTRTYLQISLPSFMDSSPKKQKHRKLVIAMGTSIGSTALLFLGVFLLVLWRKKQKQRFILGINDDEVSVAMGLGNLRPFGLRELQTATDNFNPKNILGKGGFGNVYRGRLSDGTLVAVKRLKDVCSSGEAQFKTEVEMISLAVHRNLLRLVGYCATAKERLLVYPFMSNGSVASRLRGKPALDWNARKRIALGAARGLLYLHEQCDPKIIHRDVKAANVLLDDFCEAVVGDFGLAKLLDHGDSHVTTAVRGTVGHIAPEYLSTGQSSEKTDVFGFGILLLELVSGLRAFEFGKGNAHKGAMLDWVRRVHQEKKLDMVVDKDLRSNYDRIEVGEMIQVALLCTQYLPSHRPKMSDVVRMLEGGDGLADKWEASNWQLPPSSQLNGDDQGSITKTDVLMHSEDLDDDGRSSEDVEEMELSGPR